MHEARIEWRPSRWVLAMLSALTICAVISVHAIEMPDMVAWPISVLILAYGGLLVRRECRRPRRMFLFRADGSIEVDGRAVEKAHVAWRGVLAFVDWTDGAGRRQRLSWWPDTLPAACRRELRLAAPVDQVSGGRGSVAP